MVLQQRMGNIFSRRSIEPAALPLLQAIAGFFAESKITAYLVGGFVRDTLLGRATSDIDIAINGDPLVVGGKLAAAMRGRFVTLDTSNQVGRVVFPPGTCDYFLDMTAFSGTIETDLARRDFTVNAMAVELKQIEREQDNLTVIDPFHGADDLDDDLIRAVSEKSFAADPVRLLRAVRFSAELGFNIEEKTLGLMHRSVDLLTAVAGERIREELLMLVDVGRGGRFLQYMDTIGMLAVIFPELQGTKSIVQPAEHHWDVFEHSLKTVDAVDYILGQGVWDFADDRILTEVPWTAEIAQHFEKSVAAGSTRRTLLKLAALLHDVAKPRTRTVESTGKMRFLGHNEEGARMVEGMLERLRFSAREIKLVADVVKYHLRPTQMGHPPSRRAVYRFYRDVGDAAVDVMYISLADHLATRGPGLILPNWRLHTDTIRHIMEECERQRNVIKPPRWLDGNDLQYIFGLKPGPRIGELLEELKEAQATGELTNRQEALDYIKNRLLTEGKN